jgi:Zn finger protein HypA/HybF involved in hydrogenase expression
VNLNNPFNTPKTLLANYPALQSWITILLVIGLLGFVGLGWVVKSLLILFSLLLLTPVVALVGLRWWLQRSLVQGNCPVCQHQFAGLNNTQTQCPSCGEPLQIQNRQFQRLTPPGTIDVQAVEVSAQVIDD